jgi:ankyrin repeat protein
MSAAQTSPDALFRAIRANDLTRLQALTKDASAVRTADRLNNTALHYAAIIGSAESVRILLAAGADPNARNSQDATPLIFAAYDLAKTRMLVEAGAKIDVAAHDGRTPLMVAASASENGAGVRYLIDKGAQVSAVDSQGRDALMAAAGYGPEEAVRMLLAAGADAKRKDRAGFNALLCAFERRDDGRAQLLLNAGADVNAANTDGGTVKTGPLALVRLTPMIEAPFVMPGAVDVLVKAGGRVNDRDIRGVTPLIAAVAGDRSDPALVKKLIAAGADVNARDNNGESALDWAMKFGNPGILAALRQAGAKEGKAAASPVRPVGYRPAGAADTLNRSSALLAAAGQGFFAASGCVGCHHQPMGARLYGVAHAAGLPVDEKLRKQFLDGMVAQRPLVQALMPVLADTGGDTDPLLYLLAAYADLNEPANAETDLLIHKVAASQQPEGNWVSFGGRPPISEGSIVLTSLALRALKTYGWEARREEFDRRAARGRTWLLAAKPVTGHERAERLMGLFYSGADASAVQQAARDLLSTQKPDGGWAQNPWLDSDAYATGMALHALNVAGSLRTSDAAYKRGVAYLLGAAFPDGSWYVRSRAPKFQPYFQSGFPFGHDQWISSTATAWAAMALVPAAAAEKKTTAAMRSQ